jgi:N-acetylneuraminate synthase
MELSLLKKKLIKIQKLNEKVFILGRGFSTSIFLKNIKKNKNKNLIIGFNTYEIINELDFYFTNKKNISLKIPKKKLFEINKIIKFLKKEIKVYKIGSIIYSIDPILYFINKLLEKTNIIKPLKIVFVGFDFRTSLPEGDYKKKSRKNITQSHIDITGQKYLFFKRKKAYKNLKIYHSGFDLHSDFDPRENHSITKQRNNNHKVKIVAEITTNHHGITSNIIELINAAKKAGADYVKFQMRNVDTFYPKKILDAKYKSPFGNTFREYRKHLELDDNQIKLIIRLCKKINIKPFFSVLDLQSFEKLKEYKFSLLKIPSTISEDIKFLNYIKKNYKGELVVSTGMTNKNYFYKCARLFKENKKLYLLHCISSYPTTASDANISTVSFIKDLSKKYRNIVPGYSSHDLTKTGSALAIACGARLIEKHIKINTKKWAHFDETALDVNYEFPLWVDYVRSSEKLLGNHDKKIYKSEHHKYFFRKNS